MKYKNSTKNGSERFPQHLDYSYQNNKLISHSALEPLDPNILYILLN